MIWYTFHIEYFAIVSFAQTHLGSRRGFRYEKRAEVQPLRCLGEGGWVVGTSGNEERAFGLVVPRYGPPVAEGSPCSRRGSSEEALALCRYRDRWRRSAGLPAFWELQSLVIQPWSDGLHFVFSWVGSRYYCMRRGLYVCMRMLIVLASRVSSRKFVGRSGHGSFLPIKMCFWMSLRYYLISSSALDYHKSSNYSAKKI